MVALRYRYYSNTTFTVAVAVVVAPLLLIEKNGDGSTTTFRWLLAIRDTETFELRQSKFWVSIIV